MGKLQVVVGGQYGSEAKGAVCAHLLRENRRAVEHHPVNQQIFDAHQRVLGMRVGGPNAGHTVYSDDDVEFKFRHVPVAAIADPEAHLAIAAGSEIDYEVLLDEIERVALYRGSLRAFADPADWPHVAVDRQATVIDSTHKSQEAIGLTDRVGSTAKGVGAARADRIWRAATLFGQTKGVDTAQLAYEVLANDGLVQIEGVQGYGLGLHAGHYPYCTSSDCRAIDFLSMAGLSPWHPSVQNNLEVWVVFRTRPIRVAGNSGPMKDETSWDEIGLPEERTTVTNKVRRVGGWDPDLAAAAVEANGGADCQVAVTMLDQLFPEVKGATSRGGISYRATEWLGDREDEFGVEISMVTTSPTTFVLL